MTKKRGQGQITGKDGNTFSKTNQPTGKAKSAGKKKALVLKDICTQIITGQAAQSLQMLAKYLGVEVGQIDIETAMHLKQMEKALQEGDTKAYNAVMDRLKGKPKQEIELENNIKTTDIPPKKWVNE